MARMTKEEKRIHTAVGVAFNRIGNRRQFNMMDLPKIMDAGMAAGMNGQDIEAAVSAACDQYEIKSA